MHRIDSESPTWDAGYPAEPAPRRSLGRRIVAWAGIGSLVMLGLGLVRLFVLPLFVDPIDIGPDTTVIDGPLAADGLIDYVAAMNERLSDGVTPENNAVALLVEAMGSEIIGTGAREYFEELRVRAPPAAGKRLISSTAFFCERHDPAAADFAEWRDAFDRETAQAESRAWSAEEFPDAAAWLERNSVPLEIVVAASRRPRFYSPLVTLPGHADLMSALLPVQHECRTAARLLLARAMLRLGAGDVPAAWDDILACHRLARLLGQGGTLIERLMACAVHSIACAGDVALVRSGRLTAEQARRCIMELDALPPLPTMVDAIDVGERFAAIDAIQSMIRGTAEGMDDVEALGPLRRGVLDWNLILRMFNEHFDRVVSILEQPRFADRARLMQELSAELDDRAEQRREPMDLIIGAILNRRETVSRHIGEILVALLSPSHDMAIVAQTRSLARLDLSRLAFALAACRAESGSYPDTLDTVVPEHLAEMPLDPFVDRPFHYERSAEGFRLYSVGDNMIDDGGRTFDSEPRGDDILIETPRPPKDGVEPGVAEK